MKTSAKVISVITVIVCMFLTSCSGKRVLPTEEQRQMARQQVPCVIVLPVETGVNADSDVNYADAAILEKGAATMDMYMKELLTGKEHVRIISSRQLTSLIPEDSSTQLALIKKIGSELKCNAVMETVLTRYDQRIGGNLGVDSPASASFQMKLYSTENGRVLWSAAFKETQQTLLSNIMSFDKAQARGFQWISVEELVRQGMEEKIEESPYL